MRFSYGKYKNLEIPFTYLAYPNKKIICALRAKNRETTLCFNNISTYEFSINKYVNGKKTPHYDDITIGKYILFDKVSWFRIAYLSKDGDGKNEILSVTADSIESETGETYITELGTLGLSTDSMENDGGLDLHCLYSEIDQEHSIMHKFIAQNPSWSIGVIDPDIENSYRLFSEQRVASYDLLVSTVSESYECVFQFDTFNKTVSAYKLENIGKTTHIYLSYRNLLKKVKLVYDDKKIKTWFFVCGGTDSTNTALSISDINPSGGSVITNFSYYYNDMSAALQNKLKEYTSKMETNAPLYQSEQLKMKNLYVELSNLKNAHAETEDSTDWTKYGSVALETKLAIYRTTISKYSDDSSSAIYQDAYKYYKQVETELAKRKSQISAKEKEIEDTLTKIKTYIVDIHDFLGDELYNELSLFRKEDVFTDDSFIATDIMTEPEIYEMKKALYEHAKNELAKVCYPQFTMTVDSINFPKIFKYSSYTKDLELGNFITIELDNHSTIEVRLLKMTMNWDNPESFSLTFSSRTSLEEGLFPIQDVIDKTNKLGNSLNLSSSAWNNASKGTATVLTDMSTFLNASLREVQNSADNEVNMDGTGLTIRKSNGDGTYDPCQLWATRGNIIMTDDGWKSVKIAIGGVTINGKKIFGIAADQVVGKFLLGENLIIKNKSNSFTIDDNGLLGQSTNGYVVQINPNTPSQIFTIRNGNNTILGVDGATNKFMFKGTLESTDGKIGGWTIGVNSLTSGNVGLASSGDVRIWAGGAQSSAPFRVNADGSIYTNKIQVSGGSLAIGSNFSVDSNGNMRCSNANISGTVTATSGKIGGFTIDGDNLTAPRKTQISWGDLFIDGDSAIIGELYVDESAVVGDLADVSPGHGDIVASGDLWLGDQFWYGNDGKHWSVTETVQELWNYVYNGGWKPCSSDGGGGGCTSCDEQGECGSGDGCNEQSLVDDIGAGCGCGSQSAGCTCDSESSCSCDTKSCTCDGYGSSCSCDNQACGPGDGV